jgi:dihydrofolate reductase
MFTVVCPNCNKGITVLTNKHIQDIEGDKKIKFLCNTCHKYFNAELINGKLKLYKEDNKMIAIVAVDKNWGIGKDGNLLFKIKEDMEFFKKTTTGHIVVMGSKTFESIGRPLPNRTNLILTRNPHKYQNIDRVEAYNGEDMDHILRDEPSDDIYIIGGESVYLRYIDKCDEVLVTQLDKVFDADKRFIDLHNSFFELYENLAEGEYDGSKYTISRWIRNNN